MKAFSSPGKALIAGGYLVLEPVYDSYVTALSCRMHAVVESNPPDESARRIRITSPQFHQGLWVYNGTVEAENRTNPFLQAAVETVVEYVSPKQSYDINITVYSDAGFHTQQDTGAKTSANGARTFLFHTKKITDVPKTGLGSSASLTSVVVAAIMSHFDAEILHNKDVLHNLAQIAHCKAQGKIGSGFDVATAIYGSIKYRRFQPSLINDYLSRSDTDLQSLVHRSWQFVHEPCALPPRIRLLMGDIEGGSETPKLVSTVLKWKKENPDTSLHLYTDLNAANLSLIEALNQLHKAYAADKDAYNHAIDTFRATGKPGSKPLQDLVDSIAQIRRFLKQLTEQSGAEIEPQSQTTLLDACSALPGCLGGVVPGAGGYDAISLLVVDDSIDQIITLPRAGVFANVTWLNLQEQASGLVAENPEDYVF